MTKQHSLLKGGMPEMLSQILLDILWSGSFKLQAERKRLPCHLRNSVLELKMVNQPHADCTFLLAFSK